LNFILSAPGRLDSSGGKTVGNAIIARVWLQFLYKPGFYQASFATAQVTHFAAIMEHCLFVTVRTPS